MAIKSRSGKKPPKKRYAAENTGYIQKRKSIKTAGSGSNVKPYYEPENRRGKRTSARPAAAKSRVPAARRSISAAERHNRKKRTDGFFASFFGYAKTGEADYTFMLLVGILVTFGLVMLLSASTPTADVKFGKSYYFFIRQLAYVAAGIVLMLVLSRIDYRKLKPLAKPAMLICIFLLAIIFIPHVGASHNGSRRWLNLGFTEIQPSEFTKLAIAMLFASLIEDKKYSLENFSGMIPFFVWIGITALLMMLETHLSGTIVICGIAICIMIVGGANFTSMAIGGAGVGAVGLILLNQFDSVRMARVTSFLHPFADKQAKGYQIVQSLYAIGSGGLFGKGLGQSVQKFSYLPEPYNDFIFAIVCEELGLVGSAFIIILFAGLIIRGIKISTEAPDTFGSLLVVGIMAQVAIQTILNIAVATSSIPNTGVSLPFFSYGGTALMILLAEMGIVLSVSRASVKNV